MAGTACYVDWSQPGSLDVSYFETSPHVVIGIPYDGKLDNMIHSLKTTEKLDDNRRIQKGQKRSGRTPQAELYFWAMSVW